MDRSSLRLQIEAGRTNMGGPTKKKRLNNSVFKRNEFEHPCTNFEPEQPHHHLYQQRLHHQANDGTFKGHKIGWR